ncbi:hypothetical protein RhiirA4_457472 [Rhizophagus irregularis]|uniref:DNA helicase n=1 Tax=Rhizophagus irregularis TaxID=588596 RepID=A0A2I1GA24_9GLOM|nr:hypothetical protein RhiirA4_457472 [Rhizophagus irregularis]
MSIFPVMLLVTIGATAFNILIRSAVTCWLWYLRLRQAFQKYGIQVFGGRSVILVGNFVQLPPVLDEPMYSQVLRFDSLSNDAMSVYCQFCKVYYLGVVQLQSDVLASLESARFSDATCIMPCKSNINKLRSLNSPVARTNAVHTVHTGGNDARKADSDVAKGLYLLLSRSLKKIKARPSLPIAISVEFDTYSGPAIVTIDYKKLVPIVPFRHSWEGKKGPCSRLQLPVCLAWAIAAHNLTLKKATPAVLRLHTKKSDPDYRPHLVILFCDTFIFGLKFYFCATCDTAPTVPTNDLTYFRGPFLRRNSEMECPIGRFKCNGVSPTIVFSLFTE